MRIVHDISLVSVVHSYCCHMQNFNILVGLTSCCEHYLIASPEDRFSCGECSGSVVECLTRDQGASGSSLPGITALCT